MTPAERTAQLLAPYLPAAIIERAADTIAYHLHKGMTPEAIVRDVYRLPACDAHLGGREHV